MWHFRTVIAWVWLTFPPFFTVISAADPSDRPSNRDCANAAVSVKAESSADYAEICRGAEDAIAVFGRLALQPTYPLVVEIVASLPEAVSETAVGCYLENEQRILVLAFSEFARNKTWFNVPVDRSMYRSLVTHEVAHAVAACNMPMPKPTIHAKEYLAYVAMFAAMEQGLRERVLNANPGTAFDRESKINATIYLCDPMRFAVRAYRHYLKAEHGDEFLHMVLSGKALVH